MALENYCLNIPCKSYIVKYYSSLYGHPVDLNKKSNFNDIILTKLDAEVPRKLSDVDLNRVLKGLDGEIKFRLPIDLFYRINNNITRHKIWNINRCLVNGFNNDLLWMVNIFAVVGVERRTTIEKFAQHYGIILEEDITYEALKKSEYRLRQSPAFKNFFLAALSSPYSFTLRA